MSPLSREYNDVTGNNQRNLGRVWKCLSGKQIEKNLLSQIYTVVTGRPRDFFCDILDL